MSEFITDLQIKNYRIIQDTASYCFSQDSVILANTAKFAKTDRILDLGTGCGILSVLAIIKQHVKEAVGIEIQEKVCDMAERSNRMNGIENFRIINGDIKDIRDLVRAESFDKVITNPPYFQGNAETEKNLSNIETTATLEDFIKAAAYSLKFGGDFYIVLKIDRLASLVSGLKNNNLEPKEITFVYPKLSAGVDVVIIKAKKGAKEGLISKTLIIQDENGAYTEEFQELYK